MLSRLAFQSTSPVDLHCAQPPSTPLDGLSVLSPVHKDPQRRFAGVLGGRQRFPRGWIPIVSEITLAPFSVDLADRLGLDPESLLA
jgi:hypothetical protein